MNTTAQNTLDVQTPLRKQGFWLRVRKNWQLHLLIALPVLYLIVFYYSPMYGLQIAFKDFRTRAGIWGSEWVGLKHFIAFFKAYNFWQLIRNTLVLSLYTIAASFPIPIVLALMLHVSERKVLKKLTQNVSYMPHFISVVVLVGIVNQILSPIGVATTVYNFFGGVGTCPVIRGSAAARGQRAASCPKNSGSSAIRCRGT